MSQGIGTDQLISQLSEQAGTLRRRTGAFRAYLAGAVAASLAIAGGLVLGFVGLRPHLLTDPLFVPFAWKAACSLAIAAGGWVLVQRAALPGRGPLTLAPLVPGVALLVFRAVADRSGLSIMGGSEISVQACVMTIVLVSVPALLLLLAVMSKGAPTRPRLAGAFAGLLAGALGALAYALACRNDGGLFVAVWYPVAIVITASIGAVIGRRILAW